MPTQIKPAAKLTASQMEMTRKIAYELLGQAQDMIADLDPQGTSRDKINKRLTSVVGMLDKGFEEYNTSNSKNPMPPYINKGLFTQVIKAVDSSSPNVQERDELQVKLVQTMLAIKAIFLSQQNAIINCADDPNDIKQVASAFFDEAREEAEDRILKRKMSLS
ncbi:MAG: hypothetical protein ACN2B6_04205 [Rickettsiales bacterium]